ncbi:uncharacterized protein LOC132283119 [Cornus florida]|uniref:uncharacterized protein LOC132283119 n=1 Tax=Cornus florida TaxID=4283 RepID=UPI00289CC1A8|nr:uncharacterized protein LOC132283119 [Cornus florida]
MVFLQSDLRSAIQIAATFCYLNPVRSDFRSESRASVPTPAIFSPETVLPSPRLRAFHAVASNAAVKTTGQPSICTADELHYVSVHKSDWRLALWRYKPSPKAPPRNHPLLLLSGVGTNATGYDLAPGSSFARYMSSQGYDTWILEFRGAGLSTGMKSGKVEQPVNAISEPINSAVKHKETGADCSELRPDISSDTSTESEVSSANEKRTKMMTKSDESQMMTKSDESQLLTKLTETITNLSEGLLEARPDSPIASQIRDLSRRLVNIIEGQRTVSPRFIDLREYFSMIIEDFRKQLDLIVKYDWDFDHYLEEDVPAAMDYIRTHCKPKDGKLLAIGHSMGGILLYSMLSQNSFKGRNSEFAAVVTLGSSLDYTTSKSALKLLLPLANPAQALNVPVIPLGTLLAAAYPLASGPPYVLAWLNPLISAENMMHPELFEKLVLNNFCTIPTKLLLQLTTAFREGGLCDRSGTFFYKDHLYKSNVPVLALAGDQDRICPPEAVYETVKLIPENLVTYKVFGEPGGPHYAHYDLVGSRLAAEQIYPLIINFISLHDKIDSQ